MLITLHERLLTPLGPIYIEACRAAAIERSQRSYTFDTTTPAYRQLAQQYPHDHPAQLVHRKTRPIGPPRDHGLGDTLARLLRTLGITRIVKRLLGQHCGCNRRRRWLNQLLAYR